MNINDMIEAKQTEIRAHKAAIAETLKRVEASGRKNLSAEETRDTDERFAAIDYAKAKVSQYRTEQLSEDALDANLARTPVASGATTQRRTASVSVGREAHVYNRETDPVGKQFFSDVINQYRSNDMRASQRLGRHVTEVERDNAGKNWVERSSSGVGTGAFSGLTVPQYLIDMVAPAVSNARPFADKANKHVLPASGMSVNISRITTASTAALQTSELAAVSFTDMDDTLLTIAVQTAAGQQLISRQAIERGLGVEDVILQDLMKRYNTVIDSTMITQATTGLSAVANNTDLTTGQASATAMYPAIVGAVSQSATATRGEAKPDFALMHPRRWYWLQSQLVSTWPAFGQPGIDVRTVGQNNDQAYAGAGWDGRLPCGVNVCIDANVTTAGSADSGTGEDEIYVGSTEEVHLWEDAGAPVFIRAEQPSVASLGVNLVVYGYFAYTMQRYTAAFQKLTGSGLVAPSGF